MKLRSAAENVNAYTDVTKTDSNPKIIARWIVVVDIKVNDIVNDLPTSPEITVYIGITVSYSDLSRTKHQN